MSVRFRKLLRLYGLHSNVNAVSTLQRKRSNPRSPKSDWGNLGDRDNPDDVINHRLR